MSTMMSPDSVARASLDAFARGESFVIPGVLNRVMVRVARLLPRDVAGHGAASVYGARTT
jgi:short-subunit dehydrogenase